MCNHRYLPNPNASPPGYDGWACVDCGDVYLEPAGCLGGMKTCGVCTYGISEPVSFSQHLHDRCVPDEMWNWAFPDRSRS